MVARRFAGYVVSRGRAAGEYWFYEVGKGVIQTKQ